MTEARNHPQDSPPRTHGMLLDWLAPVYDRYCNAVGLDRRFRAETLRHAHLRPGERVLDVGCGTGVLARLAREAVGPGGTVAGIDPGPVMIARARENARGAESDVDFRLAAIESLPFPDRGFDVVFSSLMLHHLPTHLKRDGLREVFRVLKPEGRLVAVDLDRPANVLWWVVAWPLLFMPTVAGNLRGAIPTFIRDAGFDQVQRAGRWYQLLSFWTAVKAP